MSKKTGNLLNSQQQLHAIIKQETTSKYKLVFSRKEFLSPSLTGSQTNILKSIGQISTNNNCFSNDKLFTSPNSLLQKDQGFCSSTNLKLAQISQVGIQDSNDIKLSRSICILNKEELQQIRERAKLVDSLGPNPEKDNEKKRLHEMSMKRVDKWPDSLLSLTQKKQKERYEKFLKVEMEKRTIDEKEEALKQERYRELIKEANQKIFEQDPRVRQFKKKLLFVEVNDERQEQKVLQKYKQDISKKMDEDQFKSMRTHQMIEEEHERQKQMQKLKDLGKMKEELQKQLVEVKKKRIEEISNDVKEGQVIKEKANEEMEENILKKKTKKANISKWIGEICQDKMKNTEMFENEKKKQIEHDQRMEEYQANKNIQMQMRKIREQNKIKEKIDIRQKMYEIQLKNLNDKVDNEESRIQQQILSQRAKEDQLKEDKEKELSKRRQLIKQNIQESIELKQNLAADKKKKEQELAQELLQQSKIIELSEQEEKIFQLKRKYEIRNSQLNQMDEKKRGISNKFEKELEEDQSLRNSIEIDRRTFGTWAESQIVEMREQGRDVKSLLKELELIQKNN